MKCERARGILERLLDGALGPRDAGVAADAAAQANAHVTECATCAAEREALTWSADLARAALATPTDAVADAALAERVIAALPAGRVRPMWPRAAVAAALFVGVALAGWQLRPVPPTDASPGSSEVARAYPLTPPPAPDWAGPRFIDVSEEAGISKVDHTGRSGAKDWMVEVVGHGAAVFDMDADGDLDLFVPDGNRLDPGERVTDTWRLYRNDTSDHGGTLTFTDVTHGSGLESGAWGGGAVAGDLDADGLPDLFVPCFGTNHLFRNLGDGRFEDTTARSGVAGREAEWSTTAALADVDGDGDLDLYVTNYADMRRFIVEAESGRGCTWRSMAVPCGPQPLFPQRDRLYLNRGDATFVDATETHLPLLARYSFQALMTDLDGDGAADVFVAADGHPNMLLINDGTGHFDDRAREAGVAGDADGRDQACMGVASGDIDGDGLIDLFVTNFSHEPNMLYRSRTPQPGQPVFVDVTSATRLDQPSFFTLGWGAALVDIDLDGDLDALSANGHLYPEVDDAASSTSYEQHVSVFENDGSGRFADVSAATGPGMMTPRVHRGLVAADFDDDGRPDFFATVMNGRAVLLRNDGRGSGGFVRLVLRRADGRTEAAGARAIVTVGERRIVRELVLGSSFGGSEDPRLLVGVGTATRASVAVRWPRRAGAPIVVEEFGELEAGGTYEVVEGSGAVRRIR